MDALVSGETWDLLRTTHGLSPDEARAAVAEAVRRILAPAPAPASNGGAGRPGEPDVHDDQSRRARLTAAEEARAEAEGKIARLVSAIAAGAPADVIAPRLHDLRAAKAAADRDLAHRTDDGGGRSVGSGS